MVLQDSDIDLARIQSVFSTGRTPADEHACQELCRYFRLASGRTLRTREQSAGRWPGHSLLLMPSGAVPGFESAVPEGHEGFSGADEFQVKRLGRACVWLVGASSRALHYAVYHLLHRMGFRWPSVGPEWEVGPKSRVRRIPDPSTRQAPRCRIRAIDPVDMIAHYTPEAVVAHLDWMARNRMNLFYFMLRTERAHVLHRLLPLAAREAALRGIDVALPVNACDVVPRELLYKHPEVFSFSKTHPLSHHGRPVAVAGGWRTAGQLCVSSPALPDIYGARLAALLKQIPRDVAIFCPLCNDGAGFCACPRCRALKPADQVQVIWNLAHAVVRRHRPDMRLGRYAYTSWQEPPRRAPLDSSAVDHVLYDVFSRNDEIPMDDPRAGPSANPRYPHRHAELMGVLRQWTRTGVAVAPWHNSMKMYRRGTAAGLVRVFARDCDLYERAGAAGCMYEAYIQFWHGFAQNFYAASRLLWEKGWTAETCLRAFSTDAFGAAAQPMLDYLRWLEDRTQRGGKSRAPMVMDRISDRQAAKAQTFFVRACRAAGRDRVVLRRIADVRDHFDYLCAWRDEKRLARTASRHLRYGRWAAAAAAWLDAIRQNEMVARCAENIESRFGAYGWFWARFHRAVVPNYTDRLKEAQRAAIWHESLPCGRHPLDFSLFDTPHLGPFGHVLHYGVRVASAAGGKGRDELGFFLPVQADVAHAQLEMTGGNVLPNRLHTSRARPVLEIRINGQVLFKGKSPLPNIRTNALTGQPENENGRWKIPIPARLLRRRNTILLRLLDPIAGYSTHLTDVAVRLAPARARSRRPSGNACVADCGRCNDE